GIGATIDFLAGRVKRAPVWMQRGGVEWLYRLAQEPRRLFKRYRKDLWHFTGGMMQQWWQLKCRLGTASGAMRSTLAALDPLWQQVEAGECLTWAGIERDSPLWHRVAGSNCHCVLDLARV